jgi:hypothetical protein
VKTASGAPGAELVKVIVTLTKQQLAYLNELGYFIRAEPGELLLALSFGAIETNGGNEDRAQGYMRDLVNWVDERRVPEVGCDPINMVDSGQFTDPALKARREAISAEVPCA